MQHKQPRLHGSDEQVADDDRVGKHTNGEGREGLVGDLEGQQGDDAWLQRPDQKQDRGRQNAQVLGQQDAPGRCGLAEHADAPA